MSAFLRRPVSFEPEIRKRIKRLHLWHPHLVIELIKQAKEHAEKGGETTSIAEKVCSPANVIRTLAALLETSPVSAPPADTAGFMRLPRAGTLCPLSGLSRSTLRNLTVPSKENAFAPLVPAQCFKPSDASKRAIWLISKRASLEVLRALPPQPVTPRRVENIISDLTLDEIASDLEKWMEMIEPDLACDPERYAEVSAMTSRQRRQLLREAG